MPPTSPAHARLRARPQERVRVVHVENGSVRQVRDRVAGEEPMEIRILAAGARASVAVTMRTPGNDFELAAGFLAGEGVVERRDEIEAIRYCTDVDEEQRYNVVNVHLRRDVLPDLASLERHFTVSSSCGVCGKAHLEALEVRCPEALPDGPPTSLARLAEMPARMRDHQSLFRTTGGLHAAAAFGAEGDPWCVREDVGRHNAFDKLVGHAMLEGRALRGAAVCVSGRASYELLQKAVAAGVSVFAAVSAPSSLAVDVARRFGVTLVAFVRPGRCTVYAGAHRIPELAYDEPGPPAT